MGFLQKLRQKANAALQIFRARSSVEEEIFISETENVPVSNLFVPVKRQEKKQELFEFLKETYVDIAETDPEMALKMLKDELQTRPEKPVEAALIEIERHIRSTYCCEYFRGVRIKKDG